MPRIRIDLSFLGTNYHGWQYQENADTVQKRVEDAFSTLYKEKLRVIGCSRTDSGVHARHFIAHADIPKPLPVNAYLLGVNSILPSDIKILNVRECKPNFNAREDAVLKQYIYKILLGSIMPPFEYQTTTLWRFGFDADNCKRATELFLGTHDFAGFTTSDGRLEKTTKTIDDIHFETHGKLIIFSIKGRSFLHKMVRLIISAIMNASSKRIELSSIKESLKPKKYSNIEPIAPPLPACGLTLYEIFYTKEIFNPSTLTCSYDIC